MATETPPSVLLVSNDYITFILTLPAAKQSILLQNILSDLGPEAAAAGVPLPNVSGAVLEKVVSWCEQHRDDELQQQKSNSGTNSGNADHPSNWTRRGHDEEARREMPEWDRAFFASLDQAALCDLVEAANYMDVPLLLDRGCRVIADMMRDLTVPEIREMFGIVNDFTPEEEERVLREFEWADQNRAGMFTMIWRGRRG
ncbi:Skp1 family, dimerization domain-containing protein [Biscogniauxia marginata]|nr:Skp1 family, dimerization domain-containing protein [Biscogniauxia marginata]